MPIREGSPFPGYDLMLVCDDCGGDFAGAEGMVRCRKCARKLTKGQAEAAVERYDAERLAQGGKRWRRSLTRRRCPRMEV